MRRVLGVFAGWAGSCPLAWAALLGLCGQVSGDILLTDVTKQTGITFVHTDGGSGQRYIVETVSAGLALFDYDNDGDIDIYFLNGAPLKGTICPKPPQNALYRNDGGWKFTDVTEQAGVGDTGYGLGVAIGDYDNDGDQDIFLNNYGPNVLYRNNGDGTFTDVTKQAGVAASGDVGAGACFLDIDGDGDLDLYVARYLDFSYDKHVATTTLGVPVYANPRYYRPLPALLYRNNGDGTFTDVTKQAGVAGSGDVGAGACFLDTDGDGDLDLYVARYLDFSYDKHVATTTLGVPVYANPRFYRPLPALLYRNNGDGTFTDISASSGIGRHAGYGMGTVCADYDGDGDTDILVANDVMANFLFRNDGTGKFEEVGVVTGFAYDLHGDEQGSMGVDCGDYDNDGLLDFYVTSYQGQLATLYRNLGRGLLEDVTLLTGAGAGTLPNVTWGNSLVDFDNDGDRDLFVACGHLQDNVERYDNTTTYLERNILLMNTGSGKFVNVSDRSGDGMKVLLSSRGAGFDDLDNDGDVDVVVLNWRAAPTVLRNDSPSPGHWLQLRLRGVKANRDAVGSRVKVIAAHRSAGSAETPNLAPLQLVDEVHSGRGYQSHYGTRLYFGLGQRNRLDRVEVRWLGGAVEIFENIPIDHLTTLTEGTGKPASK